MKNKITSLLLAATFTLCAAARAQTNIVSTNLLAADQTFFDTVGSWVSASNPLLTNTFSANKSFSLWTGAEYAGGVNVAADLGATVDVWHPTAKLTLGADAVLKNAGIAGTILGAQAGVALSAQATADIRLTGYADPGYDFLNNRFCAEIGARAAKALTDNTYVLIALGLPIESRMNGRPNLVVGTGFTF